MSGCGVRFLPGGCLCECLALCSSLSGLERLAGCLRPRGKVGTMVDVCRWFARCGRPAAGTTSHPVLGEVPTCDRCHKFATGVERGN